MLRLFTYAHVSLAEVEAAAASAVTAAHRRINGTPSSLFFLIGCFRSRDKNRVMAASAAVRSSVGLTLRLSRVIPDCSTCPLYRFKSCANGVTNVLNRGSFDSFRTINRHLQTTIGEQCSFANIFPFISTSSLGAICLRLV